jgi:hypothetical protein
MPISGAKRIHREAAVTDCFECALEAAVRAGKADRIQGFGYGTEGSSVKADPPFYCIRDVSLPRDQQRLWWRYARTVDDLEAFERQCEIERMRVVITAFMAALAERF